MRPIEADVDRKLLRDAVAKLSGREQEIITMRFGLDGRGSVPRKRWPTGWGYPNPISPAWKSASSAGSSGRFCGCCRGGHSAFDRPARRAAGFVRS